MFYLRVQLRGEGGGQQAAEGKPFDMIERSNEAELALFIESN